MRFKASAAYAMHHASKVVISLQPWPLGCTDHLLGVLGWILMSKITRIQRNFVDPWLGDLSFVDTSFGRNA